jgi:hypothetical protein
MNLLKYILSKTITIAIKINYLEMNLIKVVKELYNENYKTPIKEIEADMYVRKERYPMYSDWKN